MRIVVALGGNALPQRRDQPDAGAQLIHVRAAAQALALLANENELLICHGNGPQVGLLAVESASGTALSTTTSRTRDLELRKLHVHGYAEGRAPQELLGMDDRAWPSRSGKS